VRVDEQGVLLPASVDGQTVYDVVLNGHAAWSVTPERDGDRCAEGWFFAWPTSLRRHLVGRAEVVVSAHHGDEVLGRTTMVFGEDASREVSVSDNQGNPLVIDKWGALIRPLSAEAGSTLDELMDEVERLLADLHSSTGLPAFICYGTLLGAVRDGRLIGHDNDIDLAYLSAAEHPVDVVREGFRVERALREAGWVVRRGSGVRLNVRVRLRDGAIRFVDVFTAHWTEGRLYIPSDTGFELPRDTVTPLTTVQLMGRHLPAPGRSELLLEATYGPRWRVPDPSFRYETPRWLTRRLNGWFGGVSVGRKFWDGFAAGRVGRVPAEPTPFARWVAQAYPTDRPLVDLGTGTGRDAIWFAREHHRQVVGLDFVPGLLRRAERRARDSETADRVTFTELNLNDARQVLALGAQLSRNEDPVDLYARFTFHDLVPAGRGNLLRLASMSLRRGGHLFLEFRTAADRDRPRAFPEHPLRHFLDPDQVTRRIRRHGGEVVERVTGTGLAVFEGEDPHVCRLVAAWA
jgi:SAM-dependent methyltransferase